MSNLKLKHPAGCVFYDKLDIACARNFSAEK